MMTTFPHDCTVVVASCDAYADLLGPFSELWRKFWPDCPFRTVLVTESSPNNKFCFDEILALGKGKTWCQRLCDALDRINTSTVMLLCDDYYLCSRVDTELVLRRLEQFQKYSALNLRMIPNPRPQLEFADDVSLAEYAKNTAYCVATQAGFWDKEFLRSLAMRTDSIWEFERYGSYSFSDERRPLLCTKSKEFPFVDAVHKGYWEKFGVAVCMDNCVDVDFSRRGLPPFPVRAKECLKGFVWRLAPDMITRVQNRFGLGAKERRS